MDRRELRAGAALMAPMLVGVIPFGLVAGATPVAEGLGAGTAMGFSTIVFAGASQLAAIDVLASDGSALVATLTAITINLRMLLYSASLAPHLADQSLRRRLTVAYFLTDQAFAVSIARWTQPEPGDAEGRWSYYVGAALPIALLWWTATLVGAIVGEAVPEDVPLDFAVPLVFLVLLVPAIAGRAAAVAALVGGVGAVVAAELGAGHLSILVGALSGIIAGATVEKVTN